MSCQMFKLQIGMPLNRTKAPFTKSRLKSLNYKNGNFTHKYRDYLIMNRSDQILILNDLFLKSI